MKAWEVVVSAAVIGGYLLIQQVRDQNAREAQQLNMQIQEEANNTARVGNACKDALIRSSAYPQTVRFPLVSSRLMDTAGGYSINLMVAELSQYGHETQHWVNCYTDKNARVLSAQRQENDDDRHIAEQKELERLQSYSKSPDFFAGTSFDQRQPNAIR